MTTHEHPTKPVNTTLLDSTMVLVGESGGLSAIYDVEESSAMPGLWRVETEHGHLYLDPDEDQNVLDPEGTYELMQHLREVHKIEERDLQDRTIDPHEGHKADHADRDDLDHDHPAPLDSGDGVRLVGVIDLDDHPITVWLRQDPDESYVVDVDRADDRADVRVEICLDDVVLAARREERRS